MTKYQLQYFNNFDLAKANSSRLIGLSGSLPAHGYYMVNDDALTLCYKLTVDSVSLGLSSTAGLIQVIGFNQAQPGASATPSLQDYVGWSKTAASGAQTLPTNTSASLLRLPADGDDNPDVKTPGSGSWQSVQPDPANACGLISAVGISKPVETGLSQLLPSTEAPATIVNVVDGEDVTPAAVLPASDIGLIAPSITELLPNPVGTGNDSSDEYIELYNPNAKPFDLTGFSLQTGLSTLRTYNFPAGTMLAPNSFTAFYSETTSLSLSNTSSRALLRDPFGNSIYVTDTYPSAKDGQAWALAKGKWYWTTALTPNAANVIKLPVAAKKKTSSKTKKTLSTSAAKAKKPVATTKLASSSSYSDEPTATPIHVWALALVAGLAVLYGAYEYRTDFFNRVHQFRRHLADRRANRLTTEGRRSD